VQDDDVGTARPLTKALAIVYTDSQTVVEIVIFAELDRGVAGSGLDIAVSGLDSGFCYRYGIGGALTWGWRRAGGRGSTGREDGYGGEGDQGLEGKHREESMSADLLDGWRGQKRLLVSSRGEND